MFFFQQESLYPAHIFRHVRTLPCLSWLTSTCTKLRIKAITHAVYWLLSLKQFFINVSYHILVASLTLMALF